MRYYNSITRKWYNEGESITLRIDNTSFFSGIPTAEQLSNWGYEPYIEPEDIPTIERKISDKIDMINAYDTSPDVNTFYVNGVEAWFDKETRSNFRGSLSDAEMLGETEVSVPIRGHVVTLPIQTAKLFLAQIQRYADACTVTTSRHIEQIETLTTIEEVEDFDITADYPEKLTFTIPGLDIEEIEPEEDITTT